MKNIYKEEYRRSNIYKITYMFKKPIQDQDNDRLYTIDQEILSRLFIELSIDEAMKDCVRMYCTGDRKYVEILSVEKLGYPEGIYKFVD